MTYILILSIFFMQHGQVWKGGWGAGGAGIATAEFATKEACTDAANLFIKQYSYDTQESITAICVPKGK